MAIKRTTVISMRRVEMIPLSFLFHYMTMNIQKTITGLVACIVVVSSNAYSQQTTASAPGYLTMPKNKTGVKPLLLRGSGGTMTWAMVSNCNKAADFYPVERLSKTQSDSKNINGTSSHPAKNAKLDTNSVATQAFMRGAPISPVLIRANRCYLARSNASPMPIGTYAYLTQRNVSEALLADGIRNNNANGGVFAAWRANRSTTNQTIRSE